MLARSRKETIRYSKDLKRADKNSCEFCQIGPKFPQFIKQTKNFKVFRNIYPYSLWDELSVADHLLLAPKKHTESLSQLPKTAASEYFALISEYESQGYSVFARAPGTTTKSVAHQHTHLIKPVNKKMKKLIIHTRRPNIRIVL